jgi:class 3 adenylate cyclase/tetratricopeptide (TPR) repeat protein
VRCPSCGTENASGQKYCGECGTILAVACSACGTTNPPGQRFCGECGTKLDAASPEGRAEPTISTAQRHEAVTERRVVSVLFADLVGFTTLSESRDPEEVRDLLSKYFDACRQIVARYGGMIEKFIGDAVMAVWGTPVTHEDDAERAVRAALELTAMVTSLGEDVGAGELRARAGVLTGEAAVALDAVGQGMVAGDLVNTASRVQSVAQPGSVLVGESTKRSTDTVIAYETAGTFELKGKTEAVELWRAVRVASLRRAPGTWAVLEPPFTGRDRELRLIKELFHDSAEHGKVHLVSVQGVGGIGKSRLVWEFNKYIDGLADEIWWHQGRCLAYGEGVAFWALAEMVRGRAGILEDEESSSSLAKLQASVDRHVLDPAERRFVGPRLAHLLGLEEGGSGDQENLFSAWRIFFERLADQGPLVMVFEDIHWADSALLDFIEYIVDWSRERPIFVLTASRPELAERRPAWGAGTRNFTSIFLEPLAPDQMDSLLSQPVPGLPDDLRAKILERAEGIPFYAVETVRMLIDRGILVRDDGAFRLAGSVETLEVPESLQALIAARLDGLAPEERRLLQDAAVLGRTFTIQGLGAITGMAESEVEPLLGSLVRKEVLSIFSDPLLSDRGQYGFLQDLVKKVAYDTMSKRERKSRHLAAASYLRSVTDEDEIVEVVASHYLDAYLAAPDDEDASAIRADAVRMLEKASERAASLGANEEAQRYAERAIELAEDPLLIAELHERAGTMAAARLDIEGATAHFRSSISMFESEGATHPAARVSAKLAERMWDGGRLKEALDLMDSSFGVLSEDEPDEDLAWLAAQLGRFSYFGGDAGRAMERIERALEIAEALNLPEVLSQALNTKSLLLTTHGRANEGAALLRHALTVALDHDKPSAALRAYNNLAEAVGYADRYAEAERFVVDGLSLARRVGNRYWESSFLGMSYPKFALGRWDDALASMAEIPDDEFASARIGFSQGYVAFGTAIDVDRGDVDSAARRLERFSELETSADVQEVAEFACGAARFSLANGEPKDALRQALVGIAGQSAMSLVHPCVKESVVVGLEAALELQDLETFTEILEIVRSDPFGPRTLFFQAHSLRLEARAFSDRREPNEVERGFKGAIGSFREIAFPFWMAVTLLEYGEWLAAQGGPSDAELPLAEARDVFEQLGARPWLERVGRVAEEIPTRA